MTRETIFSPNRAYRYTLWREWPAPSPDLYHTEDPHLAYHIGRHDEYVMFIGLNPSTADETNDDPTIRKCAGFAQRWGFGALCMTNLFAFRATSPAVMRKHDQPIGEGSFCSYEVPDHASNTVRCFRWRNDAHLFACAQGAGLVIAAWGVNGAHLGRNKEVINTLLDHRPLRCLRKTVSGHPEHPLYVPYSAQPMPFP